MNSKLIESLAQVIFSLSEAERNLLYSKLNIIQPVSAKPAELLDLESRLKTFETQYKMSSLNFYERFRTGQLGDSMDFFEWSVFYEMWRAAQNKPNAMEPNH